MNINGFIITDHGQPLDIEIEDDLVAGIVLTGDKLPVFTDQETAEEVLRQYYGLHCEEPKGLAVQSVVLTLGPVVTTQAEALSTLGDDEESGDDEED